MFFDLILEYLFWFSPWISYNYYKEDYKNKIFNKLNFFCYLTMGLIQVAFILVFAIMVVIVTQLQNNIWKNWHFAMSGIAGLCILFLYIKQTWMAFELKKPLYEVVDKKSVKKAVLWSCIISFIPIVGYFTTILFYSYVSKKLKDNNFEFIYIWNRRKARRKRAMNEAQY